MVTVRRIRPTRRAVGTVLIVVSGVALAAIGGARSLGAVVVPGTVALLVGAVQLAIAGHPTVTRTDPEPGFPGERRVLRMTVDSSVPCTIRERIADGLGVVVADTPGANEGAAVGSGPAKADTPVAVPVGHGGDIEYTVELEDRGEHRLGPPRCRLVDSLGLFRYTVEAEGTATALVYPKVYDIDPTAIAGAIWGRYGDDRATFDRLREYTPEDTVRDIHWRASAKRADGEFVVAEYGGRSEQDEITIVGESGADGADTMAAAVASVVSHLGAVGVAATVVLPESEDLVTPGRPTAAFRSLARTDGGECTDADRGRADIHIRGDGDGATLKTGDREVAFESLIASTGGRRNDDRTVATAENDESATTGVIG